jgi:thiol-disulfide isomerase/thioredoxin
MRIPIMTLLSAAVIMAAEVPRPAPAFTINRVGEPPVTLKQYQGKIVMVAFIFTTCPHCQALTRSIAPMAREYAPKGVQFLECAFNEQASKDSATVVPEFIRSYQPGFPMGWALDASVKSFLQIPIMGNQLFYVPHLVFIDRQGVIQGDYAGESEFMKNPEVNIRAELEKMLKAPAAPEKKAPQKKTHTTASTGTTHK